MGFAAELYWLPALEDFADATARLREQPADDPEEIFAAMRALAGYRLDFLQTRRLDRMLTEIEDQLPRDVPRLRLALLGDATFEHLVPSIRVGALRRGLAVDVDVAPFGQWRQQILDPFSALYASAPDCVLLAPNFTSMVPELPADTGREAAGVAVEAAAEELSQLWRMLRKRLNATVIQETPWLEEPPLYGHFERQVPASRGAVARRLDHAIEAAAQREGVLLLDLRSAVYGIGARNAADIALWHHAKQAVSPAAAPWVGDHVARILAAIRGLSRKVLVLDLDNTLWGGVIGDDGLDGIVIGQGSAAGEAYAAFQRYLKRLAGRGVVLAVSSKNEPETARAAFTEHPEMILGLDDFAAFEASWNNKPAALRRIAEELSLGLDALVFVDDNPAERALMRRALPEVAVPELPEAPELYVRCLADAGYFETISFTAEDAARTAQYAANRERRELACRTPDLESFLRDLQMTLTVTPFRPADVPRITQLINKTNQFNLTTRRYTEAEVRAFMEDPAVLTFAGRLSDRFGDNGLTSVVICRPAEAGGGAAIEIDTWLMSCRVLGRGVEQGMLKVIAGEASEAGAARLLGRYLPTPRNTLVRDLYQRLGFALLEHEETGASSWELSLEPGALAAAEHLNLHYEKGAQ